MQQQQQQQQQQKSKTFTNGGQYTNFHLAKMVTRPKFEKPLSRKDFSMKFGSK